MEFMGEKMMNEFRCDKCGLFVKAELMHSVLITPDSEFTNEEYETLCNICELRNNIDWQPLTD